VLRIVFGVQGGIMAVRDDCSKEPSPSNPHFLKDSWSIQRYSRTDIDQAFAKILCDLGYGGYYSGKFQKPPDQFFADHKQRFGSSFVPTTHMDPEIFMCHSGKVEGSTWFKMQRPSSTGLWQSNSSDPAGKAISKHPGFKRVACDAVTGASVSASFGSSGYGKDNAALAAYHDCKFTDCK
jgi:hypothetical protein